MCIALLAEKYMPIQLLVEQLFVNVVDGQFQVQEVYDIFFSTAEQWEDARILCVSSTFPLSPEHMMVRSSPVPGAGGPDDALYQDSVLYSATLDLTTKSFEFTMPSKLSNSVAARHIVKGTVIFPEIRIPQSALADTKVGEIMQECGTIFELDLGDLQQGKQYMFRLVMGPFMPLGLPKKQGLDPGPFENVTSRWVQDATIHCPRTCLFNYKEVVSTSIEIPFYAEAASTIQSLISGTKLVPVLAREHLIALILPPGMELQATSSEGCAWPAIRGTLSDGRLVATYMAGTEQYWRDDPEMVARNAYAYFRQIGKRKAKSKLEASRDLDLQKENSDIIIDALLQYGVLKRTAKDKYLPATVPDDKLDGIFAKVASSDEIFKDFRWRGYQIRFAVAYRYLTTESQKALRRFRLKQSWGFWLAIAATGMVLPSFISLLIRLFRYLTEYLL